MKKIGLYLGYKPEDGGSFQYCQTMLDAVSALSAQGYAIVVACASDQWLAQASARKISGLSVPFGFWGRAAGKLWQFLRLPLGPWRMMAASMHPVAKVLSREKCDLWIFPAQDIWSYLAPVRALSAIHDLMHRYERRFPEVSAQGEYRRRERHYRHMCAWSAGILVDSDMGKQHLMESYGLDAHRIYTLPFVAPHYLYASGPADAFDSKYKLPGKFLFYPAQFWEHKNHRRLIEALEMVKPQLPDIKLVLVGGRKQGYDSVLALIRQARLSEDVLILGYVPDADMPGLYRRARALIMPTFFGPTNIPPLEAFVAGCPVAISNVYGMRDQLGDAALYFDPSSTSEIAHAIQRLWTDDELCSDLARRGRRKNAEWGQKEFNERLQRIIEDILSPAHRDRKVTR